MTFLYMKNKTHDIMNLVKKQGRTEDEQDNVWGASEMITAMSLS